MEITPLQLFQYQTISQLAAIVGEAKAIDAEQELVTGNFPMTPMQHSFFNKPLKYPHHWNQSLFFEINQALTKEQMLKITAALLQHHDALRIRASQNNSEWHLSIAGMPEELPLFYETITSSDSQKQKEKIELLAAQHQHSISLESGVLLRIVYFDTGPVPHRILIIIHHLAVDGISWRILMEDLQSAFVQISSGKEIKLPPKTTSFKRWAEKIKEYLMKKIFGCL